MPTTLRVFLLGVAVALACAPDATAAEGDLAVFVGTYTGNGSKGIYRFDFNTDTGKMSEPKLAAETVSPSFLAIDPTGRYLYAVGEVDAFQGKKGGGVVAFAIDGKSGALKALNSRLSGGAGPCHLMVDKTGKNVLVANYGGGSVAVLPIDDDGELAPRTTFIQHTGSSVNKSRQSEPHAHSVNLDPSNRFAIVADLGLDKMMVYAFDAVRTTLTPADPAFAKLTPGSGPRHFAFHPDGLHAYTINELNSTVTAWTFHRGVLTEIESVSSLPDGFKGANYPADIHVHPSGKFVYGSNRGHDSIAAFSVDQKSGKLTPVGHQGKDIKNPRNFTIDPTGKFLLVANQDLDTVVVFRIDQTTGALTETGGTIKVPRPVCLQFWSLQR
jgi:6-phosphogluconolactonase